MRAALVVLAVASAACSSPADAPADPAPVEADRAAADTADDGFDAQAWLATALAGDVDEREHTARLAEAVDWARACDTYTDPSTGETVYAPNDGASFRGSYEATATGDGEGVVAVVCDQGAYQGSSVLVRVDDAGARLLEAPALGPDGVPLSITERTFVTPFVEGDVITTFAKARGVGDCGTIVRYALGDGPTLTVEEVRHQTCDAGAPVDPGDWPVTYSRQ